MVCYDNVKLLSLRPLLESVAISLEIGIKNNGKSSKRLVIWFELSITTLFGGIGRFYYDFSNILTYIVVLLTVSVQYLQFATA